MPLPLALITAVSSLGKVVYDKLRTPEGRKDVINGVERVFNVGHGIASKVAEAIGNETAISVVKGIGEAGQAGLSFAKKVNSPLEAISLPESEKILSILGGKPKPKQLEGEVKELTREIAAPERGAPAPPPLPPRKERIKSLKAGIEAEITKRAAKREKYETSKSSRRRY